MSKRVITTLIILLLLAGGVLVWLKIDPLDKFTDYRVEQEKEKILSGFGDASINGVAELPEENQESAPEDKIEVKEQVLLDVQFIPQGPLEAGEAHWDVHAESCEEAASQMVHNYLAGITVTPQEAEDEILSLVDWQLENFGSSERDIYPEDVKKMLEGYYGHEEVRVIENASIDDIKRELSAGRPVIVPTIAAYLHNPRYYDQDYHMFPLVGYTPDRFIAHDNGTTWGDNYPYPYKDLMKALQAAGGDVVVIDS